MRFPRAIPIILAAVLTSMPSLAAGEAVFRSAPPMPRPSVEDRMAEAERYRAWQQAFRARAIAEGITPGLVDRTLDAVRISDRVVELDGAQPEFVRPVSAYMESAVSPQRVANGQAMERRYGQLLERIEARYRVDARVVLAIWGMETAYGSFRGNFDVIDALATLAYDGRRRDWAEGELIAALRILQAGDTRSLTGSWAGAMGHTQFMPTSYLSFAQDFDGDGRRNIWGEDPTDALASAANYLAENGWVHGQPWGIEVRLPERFNYLLADRFLSRPVQLWSDIGVRAANGGPLPDHGNAALLLPMGAEGPAFLTFANFDVIRTYNRSTSYALAVGHLGDRIMGAPAFAAAWPDDVLPLNRTERTELQQRLTALGYDTQGVDGRIGPNTVRAIRAFQADRGIVPDGHPSNRLLSAVRQAS
ncbi:MAG: lytic murein transglycosylase [Rubricella sp.]